MYFRRMTHPVFPYDRWACALRTDAETISRERVMVIVKNTDSEHFLIVQYTSNTEIAFVSWGIEPWDTKDETVLKELEEEAGISELLHMKLLDDWFFEVQFFSPHRKRNYLNISEITLMKMNKQYRYLTGERWIR